VIRLSHALVLALVLIIGSAAICYHRAGRSVEQFCEAASVSCEKYGLYGFAAKCRLIAAEKCREAAVASAGVNEAAGRVAHERAARHFVEASRLVRAQGTGNYATELLSRAWNEAPWDGGVRAQLIAARLQENDPAARAWLVDLAYLDDDPDALALLAREHLDTGRSSDAVGLLKHAASVAPDHFGVQLALCDALLATGDSAASQSHARRALALAKSPRDRLAARDAEVAAGGATPSRWKLLLEYIPAAYGPTALVLLAYLLLLVSPWIAARIRRLLDPTRTPGAAAAID